MFKAYLIIADECYFNTIAVSELFAKRKVYKRYKKTRNTNYKRFLSSITKIEVLF